MLGRIGPTEKGKSVERRRRKATDLKDCPRIAGLPVMFGFDSLRTLVCAASHSAQTLKNQFRLRAEIASPGGMVASAQVGHKRRPGWVLAAMICMSASMLAACGGGGGGDAAPAVSTASGGNTTPPPPPPPPPTSDTAALTWVPPTHRADGSPLSDLAGYKFYWGQSPDDLGATDNVSNPGIASYVITGLTAGTWYFAVTAYDSSGLESSFSNVVSKTVRM